MTFSALDSALTGPLFATDAMREVFSDPSRVAAMLQAEAALARAEAALGLVPDGLATAIEAISPEELDLAAIGRGTALAGVPTIPFVKQVQARLPPDLERAFHKGATTQDILDTALVLQMRAALDLIEADLAGTLTALIALAERHRETPCAGRTYGQQAAPISFGYKVATWALGIADVADRIGSIRSRVLVASLGGPVGTLAALGKDGPAVAEQFAKALGLVAPPASWHARRAGMAETAAWLALLIGALAKMATDIVDLVSTEVGEAAEPYLPGRGGSSAMPHKRNPVSATVILSAHAASAPLVTTLLQAMAVPHERAPGLWHAEWHALPQLFGLASGALAEARRLAEGLTVDAARMRANLEATRGLLFADAAAGALARQLGREVAHHLVEEAAGLVREGDATLAETLAADARVTDKAAIAKAFDLGPAVTSAAIWTDRAIHAVRQVLPRLAAR